MLLFSGQRNLGLGVAPECYTQTLAALHQYLEGYYAVFQLQLIRILTGQYIFLSASILLTTSVSIFLQVYFLSVQFSQLTIKGFNS